jgi:hypothetical protein
MIRRLLVVAALALGLLFVSAGSASASGGNIACAYNVQPLNIGVCIGI